MNANITTSVQMSKYTKTIAISAQMMEKRTSMTLQKKQSNSEGRRMENTIW
jgi:hypothetical protein